MGQLFPMQCRHIEHMHEGVLFRKITKRVCLTANFLATDGFKI